MEAGAVASWYRRQRSTWGPAAPAFHNVGLWGDDVADLGIAQDRLASRVVSHLPTAARVGGGLGRARRGLTAAIAQRRPSAPVLGVDVALPESMPDADRVTFIHANALSLPLADCTVDAITCVEAAQHFDTRIDFLAEAMRVLRPGGTLLLTDLLVPTGSPFWTALIPRENQGRSPGDYQRALDAAGFTGVMVKDITDITWTPYWQRVGSKLAPDLELPVDAYVLAQAYAP